MWVYRKDATLVGGLEVMVPGTRVQTVGVASERL